MAWWPRSLMASIEPYWCPGGATAARVRTGMPLGQFLALIVGFMDFYGFSMFLLLLFFFFLNCFLFVAYYRDYSFFFLLFLGSLSKSKFWQALHPRWEAEEEFPLIVLFGFCHLREEVPMGSGCGCFFGVFQAAALSVCLLLHVRYCIFYKLPYLIYIKRY